MCEVVALHYRKLEQLWDGKKRLRTTQFHTKTLLLIYTNCGGGIKKFIWKHTFLGQCERSQISLVFWFCIGALTWMTFIIFMPAHLLFLGYWKLCINQISFQATKMEYHLATICHSSRSSFLIYFLWSFPGGITGIESGPWSHERSYFLCFFLLLSITKYFLYH